jgi:hypothetical protein
VFLVLDRNGNGRIDGIDEMFGDHTRGPDGEIAANGFEALRKYDANKDGVVDGSDAVFAALRVWADVNANGETDAGELRPLGSSDIRAIRLAYTERLERADFFGNESRQRSLVELGSGAVRRVFDVYFVPGM